MLSHLSPLSTNQSMDYGIDDGSSDSDDTDDSCTVNNNDVEEQATNNKKKKKKNNFYPIKVTLTAEEYDAETIREEFKRYQSVLPKPDKLLQEQTSCEVLCELLQKNNIDLPRFIQSPNNNNGIRPHYALCCLLFDEIKEKKCSSQQQQKCDAFLSSWLVWFFTFGCMYRQNHVPADIIREQFYRVAHVIPTTLVRPSVLRKRIRSRNLPIPNFFLDPEDDKQFPPHIALLVILQDGKEESSHFGNIVYKAAWSLFAFWALVLRLVLEVIGGAGAIWGGSEVFGLRYAANAELWRWLSIAVGILCFLRFVTLNAPQKEDVGDILGPAGPWSLRAPRRLRAVCEHPFHYFVRAQKPYDHPHQDKKEQ